MESEYVQQWRVDLQGVGPDESQRAKEELEQALAYFAGDEVEVKGVAGPGGTQSVAAALLLLLATKLVEGAAGEIGKNLATKLTKAFGSFLRKYPETKVQIIKPDGTVIVITGELNPEKILGELNRQSIV